MVLSQTLHLLPKYIRSYLLRLNRPILPAEKKPQKVSLPKIRKNVFIRFSHEVNLQNSGVSKSLEENKMKFFLFFKIFAN